MKISLSILNLDYAFLYKNIKKFLKYVDYLHMDVMSYDFVSNCSFGPYLIDSIKKRIKNKIIDTHLMIDKPDLYVNTYNTSDIITFHFESSSNVLNTICEIKKMNKKVGISINPETDVNVLKPYLADLDLILIMSVKPGYGGQKFVLNSIDKVKYLKEIQKDYKYIISIDGGINNETIKDIYKYVDICVIGSYLTKSKNIKKSYNLIKEYL